MSFLSMGAQLRIDGYKTVARIQGVVKWAATVVGKETSRMDHATIYSREDENNMLNSLAHSFSILRERCIRFLGQRR